MNLDNLSVSELEKMAESIKLAINNKREEERQDAVMELKQRFYNITNNAEYLKIGFKKIGLTIIVKLAEVKRDFMYASCDGVSADLKLYGTCYNCNRHGITKSTETIFNFDLSTLSAITKNEFDEVEDAYNRIIRIMGKN